MKVFLILAVAIASVYAGNMPQVAPMQPSELPAVAPIEGRITNGNLASQGQFKYMVGVGASGYMYTMWCSGSLISDEWILTSASCIKSAQTVRLFFGSNRRATGPLIYTRWPKFMFRIYFAFDDNTLVNNVGLIRIQKINLDIYPTIRPVKLPAIASSYPDYLGDLATVTGWGSISVLPILSFNLRFALLSIIPSEICEYFYNLGYTNILCTASYDDASICFGDEGSPLVNSDGELIGIASIAPDLCSSGYPAVFTKITPYLEWIKRVTRIYY